MELLIIIFAGALAIGGFIGGLWLWEKMAESPIWEQMRKCLKIISLGGATGLFVIVVVLVWKMETQPLEFFRQCIPRINIGSWFLFFYMLGYDASILRPQPEGKKASHRHETSKLKCHLKWDLLRRELFACLIAIPPRRGIITIF